MNATSIQGSKHVVSCGFMPLSIASGLVLALLADRVWQYCYGMKDINEVYFVFAIISFYSMPILHTFTSLRILKILSDESFKSKSYWQFCISTLIVLVFQQFLLFKQAFVEVNAAVLLIVMFTSIPSIAISLLICFCIFWLGRVRNAETGITHPTRQID